MNALTHFLFQNGYTILFLGVLVEQIGLPLPSGPMLLAAGALVGAHRMNPWAVLGVAISASLISDSIWYCIGRRRGGAILGRVCRISLEPYTCLSQTYAGYSRFGANALLFCKFVPGLGTLGPPMAGMSKLSPWKFLLLDAGGALTWSLTFVSTGWVFREQLESLAGGIATVSAWVGFALAFALAVYIAVKYVQRRRIYRTLRIAQITPGELNKRMEAREALIILDLRNPVEWQDGRIPGSLQFEQDKLDSMVPSIARAEVILYCSRPNRAAGARAAIQLERRGVGRVRPLEGGFARWHNLGFPVEKTVATGRI